MVALDLLKQLQPVEPAALQPDIEKYEIWPPICDFCQGRIAIARRSRRKTLVVKNPSDKVTNVGFVIDNQNIACHGSRLSY
jgi:hypothetical protein